MTVPTGKYAQAVESAFLSLLNRANELPQLISDLDPTFPGPVALDEYPATTLGWLRSSASLTFQATLAVLAIPFCAGEAEILARTLIEGFAHAAYIYDGSGDESSKQRTARCRAICLELGIAKQRMKEITSRLMMPTGADRSLLQEGVSETLARIETLHAAEGCTCRGRGFQVQRTLSDLAAFGPAGAIIHDEWFMYSGAAHSFMPSRIYSQTAEGQTLVGGPIRFGARAMLLKLAVDILHLLGICVLVTNDAPRSALDRLRFWVAEYTEIPPLRNALRGEFD
jgi:hypothetical protein